MKLACLAVLVHLFCNVLKWSQMQCNGWGDNAKLQPWSLPFFFFGFVAVLQCNVMPTRILSLHMRFCFLLQRSCFAWFAFWRANRLKELVCLFFTSANCQLLWNGEERREPSISISALVVFGNSLRLVALRIDMSSHLWLWLKKYKKKKDCCYVLKSKLRKKNAKMLWVTGE